MVFCEKCGVEVIKSEIQVQKEVQDGRYKLYARMSWDELQHEKEMLTDVAKEGMRDDILCLDTEKELEIIGKVMGSRCGSGDGKLFTTQ